MNFANAEFNSVLFEDFLTKYIKICLGEQKCVNYSLTPEEIQNILMRNPESFDDIYSVIEFLIRLNNAPSDEENLTSSNALQEKLLKYLYLGENRIKSIYNQINQSELSFFIKQIESTNYNSETLIFSYTSLINLINSNFNTKKISYTDTNINISQLIEIYKSYSIQSNFSPFNSNLLRQINEGNDELNIFKGISPGSPQIFRRGVISNGQVVFVLHSDFYLSLFPISVENGGLYSPSICKLRFDSNFEDVSLSIESNKLVVTSPNKKFKFDIELLITLSTFTIGKQCCETEGEQEDCSTPESFILSDGVVNVTVKDRIATVTDICSEKVINVVCLHNNDNEEFEVNDDLFNWPVETNGLVLSFYVKTSPNQVTCRQFSLIDGSHLKDEVIQINVDISAISYDSINQVHHVVINNNNQTILYSITGIFDSSINPFLFGFFIPEINYLQPQKKSFFWNDDSLKNEKELASLLSSILLSSIFFKKDIQTFIINEKEKIFDLPLYITEISESLKIQSKYNSIKIESLQILSILFVINIRHQLNIMKKDEDQNFQEKCQSVLQDIFFKMVKIDQPYSMNIISFIFLNLFDLLDFNNDYQAILEGLLLNSSPVQAKYIIHVLFENQEKTSMFSFSTLNDAFNKYCIDNYPMSKTNPNIMLFLLSYQRCLINQLHMSIKKEHFSTASLVTDIKYNDCKTDNETLNKFAEYTTFLVNQFSSSIVISTSFDEFQKTVIYCLFDNLCSLISGLYKYHEIAQIVAPLFFIFLNLIKSFFEKMKIVPSVNVDAQKMLVKMGLSFGSFLGTLIKGGNYSLFDEKYKWLIRPNMNLINHPDVLNDLDNPTTNLEVFHDENVRAFLSQDSDESVNGKKILQDIYKKWNYNMNKNLNNQSLLDLDQLFLAVELYHLNLFEDAKNRNINKLRPALQQMMRVRNTARSILRSNNPIRTVSIISEEENISKKTNDSLYSPFDLIVIKCKMLLKLKSKFDSDNISIAPKLLADFVLSNDQSNTLINYISNQRNRLQLTNIGFSLIKATYSLKMDDLFLSVIDATLSISVDNFDGLSAIIRYDNEHKSEKHICDFISKALNNVEYPYLYLIIFKFFKCEVLSNEIIGKLIEPFVKDSLKNIKLFAILYNKFEFVPNLLNSDHFLFLESKTGKKVPFISLSVDDYDKISNNEWYLISMAKNKTVTIYSNILKFFLNSVFNSELNNLDILSYLAKYINSFYENKNISLDLVKNDFLLLLNSLSKSLKINDNYERANEIVAFFRRILSQKNEYTNILVDMFSTLNKEEETLCSIFAILGGFIDVIQPYNYVTFQLNREILMNGILLNYNKVIKIPIKYNTKPIEISCIYAKPLYPFACSLFQNNNFILNFIDSATKNLEKPIASLYLKSLSYYLREDNEIVNNISKENASLLISKLAPLMNPFDTMKETEKLISVLLSKKKTKQFKKSHFSVMSSESLKCTTYLSPVIQKKYKYTVIIQTTRDFKGYLGIISDNPLSKQFPYYIIDTINGEIIPNHQRRNKEEITNSISNIIEFSIDFFNSILYVKGRSKAQFPLLKIHHKLNNFRIFISVVDPCKILSIDVLKGNSNQSNQINDYATDYKPQFEILLPNIKNKKMIEYDENKFHNISSIYENESQIPHNLMLNFNNPELYSYPVYETINNNNILYNFNQADSISSDLINSICYHVNLQLITQLSTLIMMKLVNLDFGDLLYSFDSNLLIKLFSYIQIPLESFNNNKLVNKKFPFIFNESILNNNNSTLPNKLFDNIEIEMKKCLQKIPKINTDFPNVLKNYIENMRNDLAVHTLRNTNLNIEYYYLTNSQFSHHFENISNIESMIMSAPFIYKFDLIHFDNTITNEFPSIYNINDIANELNMLLHVYPLINANSGLLILFVNRNNNHWVFGTSFELLLLLKEYYLMSKDPFFIRTVLVDLIIADSPFVSIFVPELLNYYSHRSFLEKSQFTNDYLTQLAMLAYLISNFNRMKNTILTTFLMTENSFFKSKILADLIPFFPEIYDIDNAKEPDQKLLLPVTLEDLDISNIRDPFNLFLNYKNFLEDEIDLIPTLNLWISASIYYNNHKITNNNSNDNANVNNDNDNDNVNANNNNDNGNANVNNDNDNDNVNNNNENGDDIDELNKIGIFLNSGKDNKYLFSPSKLHDTFINEISILKQLKNDDLSEIIEQISYDLFSKKSFGDIFNIIFSKYSELNIQYSPRILTIALYIIHRFNYIYMHFQNHIPEKEWHSISNFLLLSNEVFIDKIKISELNPTHFTLHRFEAHRISFEGNGRQDMSMIAQVSDNLSRCPANFRQKKTSPWHVKFTNEAAQDAGGPTRELFTELAMSILEPTSGLFIISPNGRNRTGSSNLDVYVPFHSSPSNSNLIELTPQKLKNCYISVGVFIGIIIRTGYYQDLPLAPFVWKAIGGKEITADDIFKVDQEFKKFISKFQEASNDIEKFNELKQPILWKCENWDGSMIDVPNPTENETVDFDNVKIFIENCINLRINFLNENLNNIKFGFIENIGIPKIPIKARNFLSVLVQGPTIISIEDMVKNFKVDHIVSNNFWYSVEKMTNKQRSLLLKFITGLPKLQNIGDFIYVNCLSSGTNKLPEASTCFKTLRLPLYESKEITYQKLLFAIEHGQTMEKA